jgi:D-tyrosyl-tRNA(Tyr) deacylase
MPGTMRAVVQRVSRAEVRVDGIVVGAVERGFLVLLGVARADVEADAAALADKVAGLRVFEDAAGKMNLALAEVGGGLLVVSQFTLLGDVRKGNRPSFVEAAPPEHGEALYRRFCELLRGKGLPVATGTFRAMMAVELVNDGPVTILLDSRKAF